MTANKICHNDVNEHNCNHCDVGCTDDNCDQGNCEIIKDLNGKKHMTCMCPKTSCVCLGREPTKTEFMNHLVEVYTR